MDEWIGAENPVRLIDALVEALNIDQLGFAKAKPAQDLGGRPSYPPKDLLKLYLYGYYNRIRSSRMLERECTRNMELRWLINGLVPNYHTIADFRKDHRKELKNVFKKFTSFLLNNDLLNGENVAVDGTKIRAVNAKKNNFNAEKVNRHLEYIDNKTEDYFNQLDSIDQQENKSDLINESIQKIQSKISKLKERKIFYNSIAEQLSTTNDSQVSTTDSESRSMPIHHNQIEVAYNIQCATDDKHCLIIHFEATNENDTKALFAASMGAKTALEKTAEESITILADKGYHNGAQLHLCEQANIQTIVAQRERSETQGIPTPEYFSEKFSYNKESQTYNCPAGKTLTTNGSWYTKDHTAKTRKNSTKYHFQQFKTSACKNCSVKHFCTKNKIGRIIDRSEYQDTVDKNNARIIHEKERYLLRQQIVEHPFGTIKRAWGYYFTLLKGKEKVNAEYAIIFTIYNLRRVVSILGVKELLKRLKTFKQTVFCLLYSIKHSNTYSH